MALESRPSSPLHRWLAGRPALMVAGGLASGIALHSALPRVPLLWLATLIALIALTLEGALHARRATGCIFAAVVCAGALIGQLANYQFPRNHIALFTSDQPRLAWLELQFDETPAYLADPGPRRLGGRQVGNATVVAIRTQNGWEKASGQILFSAVVPSPRIVSGQRVRVVGMLERPAPAMNPGTLDWELYCRRHRVLASIRANRDCDVEVMSGGASAVLSASRVGVREWLALGFSSRQQVDRSLLQALLLGDRGPELRGVERDFQKTGASHLLASSGVRMSVLAAMLYVLSRVIRLRPRVAGALVALGVLGWGCVTLSTPQALRPVIIAGTIGIGLAGRRTVDSVQLLAFAAVAILIVQPLDLYSAGFQFSFIIVLGILLFTHRVTGKLQRFQDPDFLALDRFGKLTRWQRVRARLIRHLLQLVAVSAVAWVVSIPLVAYHFEQVTPWAAPISILLSPVVLAAVAAGFFKLVATMLFPSMAGVWATIAVGPVALLRGSMSLAAHLPLADIPVTQPSLWMIFLFYFLICLPLLPVAQSRLRWSARCGPVGALAIVLLMPWLLGSARQSRWSGRARITLLSIGAGQCAVVEPPGAGPLMVDAGSTTLADPLHLAVGPFLHHQGKRELDAIYLSHGDYDHISATEAAVEEWSVGQVVTSPFFRRHARESRPCQHLLQFLDAAHRAPREVTAGQCLTWGGGVTAEVLWPPKQCDMNTNNAGMVLRMTYAGRSILFPADIQDPAMRELLKQPQKLRSDILVAAHHGSSEPLTAEFVRAVNPSVIVSSNAARLTKKQRDFEQIIERRPLYRTSEVGAITIEIEREGRLTVTPFLERKQKGVVVERDGRISLTP